MSKDNFIQIFKYTGDFAKLRSKKIKQVAQDERLTHFNKDHKLYLEALKKTVNEEEKAYEQGAQIIFDKLKISKEDFDRSQQYLMNDPHT